MYICMISTLLERGKGYHIFPFSPVNVALFYLTVSLSMAVTSMMNVSAEAVSREA